VKTNETLVCELYKKGRHAQCIVELWPRGLRGHVDLDGSLVVSFLFQTGDELNHWAEEELERFFQRGWTDLTPNRAGQLGREAPSGRGQAGQHRLAPPVVLARRAPVV
jgi:hypothetical protein